MRIHIEADPKELAALIRELGREDIMISSREQTEKKQDMPDPHSGAWAHVEIDNAVYGIPAF